jgi:hypothetical protein
MRFHAARCAAAARGDGGALLVLAVKKKKKLFPGLRSTSRSSVASPQINLALGGGMLTAFPFGARRARARAHEVRATSCPPLNSVRLRLRTDSPATK